MHLDIDFNMKKKRFLPNYLALIKKIGFHQICNFAWRDFLFLPCYEEKPLFWNEVSSWSLINTLLCFGCHHQVRKSWYLDIFLSSPISPWSLTWFEIHDLQHGNYTDRQNKRLIERLTFVCLFFNIFIVML